MADCIQVSVRFVLILGSALLLSCLEGGDSRGNDVDYDILYDVTDKEIDVREACRTAVVALRDQAALDAFVAEWSVRSDSLSLPGVDFGSRRILGIVTRRNGTHPTYLKIAGFKTAGDSLRLALSTACSTCNQDSFSGDVLILSYAATEKPLAVTLNGKPLALADSVQPHMQTRECSLSD